MPMQRLNDEEWERLLASHEWVAEGQKHAKLVNRTHAKRRAAHARAQEALEARYQKQRAAMDAKFAARKEREAEMLCDEENAGIDRAAKAIGVWRP